MTKPTLTTLAIGLLVLASSASFSQDTLRNKKPTEISIIEAIENEMLDVVVSGSYDSRIFREVVDANGIYYGKCMSIVLKSKIDTFVLLRLDCGMKLVPSDTFFQTMIATQKAVFPLYPNQTYATTFYSMCGQMHDASPNINATFSIGELGDTGLVKLANYLGENYIQNMPGQHALWAYTDQADFDELKFHGADSLSIEATKKILYHLDLETKLTPKLLVTSAEESNDISINRYFMYTGLGLLLILLSTVVVLIVSRPKNDNPIAQHRTKAKMKDGIKLILLIAILSAVFDSCKEGGKNVSNPIQISQDTKAEKSKSSEVIVLNEKNYFDNLEKGSEINLDDYLKNREFSSTLPLTKIITNELNEEYLIIRYFSGTFHCCVITEILSKENMSGKYNLISSISEDGDSYPIKYPFNFYNRHNYFYSCYACMKSMDCKYSLSFKQTLKANKIVTSVVGSKEEYAKCLMNYLSKNYIPELNDEKQDNGEREVILNAVEKLYWAEMDIAKIFNIYSEYANDFSDKPELWIEILNQIGMEASIVTKQH